MYISIFYIDFPKGRLFIMLSTYKAISNAIVNYITPHVVLVINLIEEKGLIKVPADR